MTTTTKSPDTKNSGKTTLFIADDHPVVLEGVRMSFEKEADFQILGTASDGVQAVQEVKRLNPDIVIMDIGMPRMRGMDAAQEIRTWNKAIRIVIYTMHSDREYVAALFRIGINGYVLKQESMKDLVRAVRVVKDGGTYLSNSVNEMLREEMDKLVMGDLSAVREMQDGIKNLTVREKEVFVLLADGLTPREIAERLFISPKTVETHKYNIMEKLEVSSVAQLTKIAAKKGLIDF